MIASRPHPYPARVYYHFVSWLLAATTPLLLMLAAVGLERIETELQDDAPVAPFFQPAPFHQQDATNAGATAPGANPQFHPTRRPNPV